MATLRKRSNGHWQARVRKANQTLTKTFINKVDAKKWAKQVEVELDKGSFVNLALAERTTFKEVIERYITEVLPTMRGGSIKRMLVKHKMGKLSSEIYSKKIELNNRIATQEARLFI